MLPVQPLTKPVPGVVVHDRIGSTDRAEAKVIAPAPQPRVEFGYLCFHWHPVAVSVGKRTDLFAEGRDTLFRWLGAYIGTPIESIASPHRVAQEVERLLGYAGNSGLLRVDRELQPPHQFFHLFTRLFGPAATQDDEVIGVDHDVARLFQFLPAQHESPHV